MRKAVLKIAPWLGAFLAGAMAGPVAIAASSDDDGRWREAKRMIDIYRSGLRPNRLFLTVRSPDDGRECGYEPGTVFPASDDPSGARRLDRYNGYYGYASLDHWRRSTRDEAYLGRIQQWIVENVSPFEIAFLRRCMEGTIASPICARRVKGFGDRVPRFAATNRQSDPPAGYQDKVVCTFVDGVAARKGLELAPLESRKHGPDHMAMAWLGRSGALA